METTSVAAEAIEVSEAGYIECTAVAAEVKFVFYKDREDFRTLGESLVQMTTFISRIFFKLVELQFQVPISAE